MHEFTSAQPAVIAAERQPHALAEPHAAAHEAPCHPGERLLPSWDGGLECPVCGIPWQLTALVRPALICPARAAVDERIARWDLPAEPVTAGRARARVREALAGWGLAPCDGLVLGVSELVTNAVLHGAEPVELCLRAKFCDDGGATVACEVSDSSALLPRFLLSEEAEHGRGLQIVAALASAVDVRPTVSGKTVRFSMAVPVAAGPGQKGPRVREGAAA